MSEYETNPYETAARLRKAHKYATALEALGLEAGDVSTFSGWDTLSVLINAHAPSETTQFMIEQIMRDNFTLRLHIDNQRASFRAKLLTTV